MINGGVVLLSDPSSLKSGLVCSLVSDVVRSNSLQCRMCSAFSFSHFSQLSYIRELCIEIEYIKMEGRDETRIHFASSEDFSHGTVSRKSSAEIPRCFHLPRSAASREAVEAGALTNE